MKRNQWLAVLLALLLFASGAAVGALAHRYYTATQVNAKTTESSRQRYISEMRSKLKLTTAQVRQLETIADDTKTKYKAVRDSYRPEMLKVKQDHIDRVKAILTPQQVPLYERLVAERERGAREQEEREHREERSKTP